MALKLSLLFMFFLVVVCIVQAAPETERNAQETINDTIQKISSGFDELVDKIKNSEIVQETGRAFSDLGKKIQETGQEAYDKLKAQTPST